MIKNLTSTLFLLFFIGCGVNEHNILEFDISIHIQKSDSTKISETVSYIISCDKHRWASFGETDSSILQAFIELEDEWYSEYDDKKAELNISAFVSDTVVFDTLMYFSDLDYSSTANNRYVYKDTFYVDF